MAVALLGCATTAEETDVAVGRQTRNDTETGGERPGSEAPAVEAERSRIEAWTRRLESEAGAVVTEVEVSLEERPEHPLRPALLELLARARAKAGDIEGARDAIARLAAGMPETWERAHRNAPELLREAHALTNDARFRVAADLHLQANEALAASHEGEADPAAIQERFLRAAQAWSTLLERSDDAPSEAAFFRAEALFRGGRFREAAEAFAGIRARPGPRRGEAARGAIVARTALLNDALEQGRIDEPDGPMSSTPIPMPPEVRALVEAQDATRALAPGEDEGGFGRRARLASAERYLRYGLLPDARRRFGLLIEESCTDDIGGTAWVWAWGVSDEVERAELRERARQPECSFGDADPDCDDGIIHPRCVLSERESR